MDINTTTVLSFVATGISGWFANQVVQLGRDFRGFRDGNKEWQTAQKERVDFIYERLRFTIATEVKSNPVPEDVILDTLTSKFISRTISHTELSQLIDILEQRKRNHKIEKEQRKAENFLELIRYEYQLHG